MIALLHLVLVSTAAAGSLLAGPILAAWWAGAGSVPFPMAELRRLWRKEAVGAGPLIVEAAVAAGLACNAGAALLVPTVLFPLPEPFGNVLAVWGLLAAGRVVSTLLAAEARGSFATGRSALFLAAAGPAAALVTFVAGGPAGSASLQAALAALRDSGGPPLPPVLAAAAVAVLGWADLHVDGGIGGRPDPSLSGRTAVLARISAALRCAAWIDLVAVLLPPAPPDGTGWAMLLWAVKAAVLLAGLGAATASGRAPRPVAAPALAGVLGLLGALLMALRGGSA